MSDVAKAAGVGVKTVSRVVNGEPWVSAKTEAAVRRAIRELGFTPNASARNLRRGSTGSIGLVVEDVAEPFQAMVTRAVEQTVFSDGHLLFTASSQFSPEREEALLDDLNARQVDGLIVIPTGRDHHHLQSHVGRGAPMVFIDRPPLGFPADVVMSDNYSGTRSAVEHLLNTGHQRVGFVSGRTETFTGAQRLSAYEDSLAQHGIEALDDWKLVGPPDGPDFARRLCSMLEAATAPTALFTASSVMSLATIRILRGLPHRPALVGFDDFPSADLFAEPVTVVAQDAAAIGRTAAQLLLRRLKGDNAPPQRIELATSLIVRHTA